MKYLLFLLLIPTTLSAQRVINMSKSTYEIEVWKNDVKIHHHLMKYKDCLYISDVGEDDIYVFKFRIHEYHCDNGNPAAIHIPRSAAAVPPTSYDDKWVITKRPGSAIKTRVTSGVQYEVEMFFPFTDCLIP